MCAQSQSMFLMLFCAPYEEDPVLPIYVIHVIKIVPFILNKVSDFKNKNIKLLIS